MSSAAATVMPVSAVKDTATENNISVSTVNNKKRPNSENGGKNKKQKVAQFAISVEANVYILEENGRVDDFLLGEIIKDMEFVNKYYYKYEHQNPNLEKLLMISEGLMDPIDQGYRGIDYDVEPDAEPIPLTRAKMIERTNEYIVALGNLVTEIKKEINKKTNHYEQ